MNPRLELLANIIKFEIINRYLIEGKMIPGLCSSSKFLSSFLKLKKLPPPSSITLNPRLSGLQVSRGENVTFSMEIVTRLPRRVSFPSRLRNRIMDRQTSK